ncbi:MAG: MFS transporter [Candidatus Bathyarchaeia archaeon]
MRKKDSRAGALRNVFALGFVSFFTDISSEMCFSLLPTFILGLPGSNRAVLGIIEGVAEALSYGMRAVSGVFSDKFRRRKSVVLVGYSLSNIVKPLFAVAQTAVDALVIRVTDRVGKGVRTSPRDALLSESISGKRRGAAFGLHRTLDQTGAILGPVIASTSMLLLGLTARDVFWLSFVPGFIALVILLFLVEERVGKPVGELKLLSGVRTVLRGGFPLLLLIVGVFSLGAFNFSFVLINALEAGVLAALIPLVYAVINISHTVIAIPAGLLSDRIGREKVLVMGYGAFLVTALLILLSPKNLFYVFLVAVVFGVYAGIVETVQRALIPEYADSSLRGTAYGLYYLVVGSAFFGANTFTGLLWESFGSSAAIYSIISSSTAIISMMLFLKHQESKQ